MFSFQINLILLCIIVEASAQDWIKYCEDGHSCSYPFDCCGRGCCYVRTITSFPTEAPAHDHILRLFLYSHWYFWIVVVATFVIFICTCWVWRQRRVLCGCGRVENLSDRDSAGSCYYPPQYSRCNSFVHPPHYTEVTTKPDLYPLVITQGENSNKRTSNGNFVVRYFKNHILRQSPGSLSATSTADSLNSSFVCNAANEANTVEPPPYSSAGAYDEWRAARTTNSNRRQALLRSVSTMSWCQQPLQSLPTPTSAHFPSNLISPSQNSSIIAQYFNEGGTSALTLNMESPGFSIDFHERLMTSPPEQARFNINDIELELIDYDIKSFPDPILSELTENRLSSFDKSTEGTIIEPSRSFFDSKTSCISPPQPTSPTFLTEIVNKIDSNENNNNDTMKIGIRKKLPLQIKTAGETSRARDSIPTSTLLSLSAPSTPSGVGFTSYSLSLHSKKKSKSGSSSKLKSNKEESDPLLTQCDDE